MDERLIGAALGCLLMATLFFLWDCLSGWYRQHHIIKKAQRLRREASWKFNFAVECACNPRLQKGYRAEIRQILAEADALTRQAEELEGQVA